jgi:hypothetical protein
MQKISNLAIDFFAPMLSINKLHLIFSSPDRCIMIIPTVFFFNLYSKNSKLCTYMYEYNHDGVLWRDSILSIKIADVKVQNNSSPYLFYLRSYMLLPVHSLRPTYFSHIFTVCFRNLMQTDALQTSRNIPKKDALSEKCRRVSCIYVAQSLRLFSFLHLP